MTELAPQKLGRIIRLDAKLRESPAAPWIATAGLHGLFALCVAMVIATGVLETHQPRPDSPEDAEWWQLFVFTAITWLLLGVGLKLLFFWQTSFELQLLPGAVRITKWGRTTLLIEPEVVGGNIIDRIHLRAGQVSSSIPLYCLNQLEEKAAVIEHCSQFLSAEQQARDGRRWARLYYRLITRKPLDRRRLLRATVVCLLVCGAVVIGSCESILWYWPDATLEDGQSLRVMYIGVLGLAIFLIGGQMLLIYFKPKGVVD